MPITASDIQYYLATTAGAAGFSTAQPLPNSSLGKYISTTQLVGATLNNLFDSVSAQENADSDVEYRLLFVLNNHASLVLSSVKLWLVSEFIGGATAAISVDATGVTDKDQAGIQAKTIANENTAPTSQSFSAPTTFETGLDIADLEPGQCQGIWVRRTASNSIPMSVDGVTLRITGATAA